jgi:hypothetical protein
MTSLDTDLVLLPVLHGQGTPQGPGWSGRPVFRRLPQLWLLLLLLLLLAGHVDFEAVDERGGCSVLLDSLAMVI